MKQPLLQKKSYFEGILEKDWQEDYPDCCVLLHRGSVLTFSKNLREVDIALREAETHGIHPEEITVLFIDDPRRISHETARNAREFHPRTEAVFVQEVLADMHRNIRLETELDTKMNRHEPLAGKAYAEETHKKTTDQLNRRYTPAQWDALVCQAVKTRNENLLRELNDHRLHTNKQRIKIASTIIRNMKSLLTKA